MDFKKLLSLSVLICGVGLFYHPVTSHAIEYKQEWIKSWGGNGTDVFTCFHSTSDKGFVGVGYSQSTDAGFANKGGSDAIIAKYDSDGNQEWLKSWGGSNPDSFSSFIETADGGFIVVGSTQSSNAGVTYKGAVDVIIVKYDSEGNQQWVKSWGGNGTDGFNSILPTSDGGFVAVVQSISTNAGFVAKGDYDSLIIKYDSEGNQEWLNCFNGTSWDRLIKIINAPDGGFVAIGETKSTNAEITNRGQVDIVMVKYDSEGNQQWARSWGGNGNDTFQDAINVSDGGFAIVGYSNSNDTGFGLKGNNDAFVLKYNQEGIQEWVQIWGGNGSDGFNTLKENVDGNLVAVGYSTSADMGFANQGVSDIITVKYDREGNSQGVTSWGGNGMDVTTNSLVTADGGILLTGYTQSTDIDGYSGGNDIFLLKYDLEGNQEWLRFWGGSQNEYPYHMIETSDGEILISGYTPSTDAGFENQGDTDVFILKYTPKTDSDIQINGNVQTMVADITIPSVSPDLVINPNLPEGSISPEFTISNDSVSPIKLELKTFEQTTNTFNDVLPSKYDSWVGLNKTQSQDIALGLDAKEGDGWQTLTTPTSYVANHIEHEIGIIKPTSSVDFSFDIKHGTSFSEAKMVQYKMVFVFDLLN